MSLYCRITGKSRGLPKPNYFPLLPPISPADAKKLCRITGKTVGLPATHHFIPIPLIPKKKSQICPITGKSVGQAQHHFIPELPGKTAEIRHLPITGFRYVVPVLDSPPQILQDILGKDVNPDEIVAQYVYTLEEKNCGIVIPGNIEAAVRQGTVSSIFLDNNSEKVAIKLLEGTQITIKVADMKIQPSINMEITENWIPLLDGQGPTQKATEKVEKKKKRAAIKAKKKEAEMDSMKRVFEEKEQIAEKAELESIIEKKPKIEIKTPTPEPMNGILKHTENNDINNIEKIKKKVTTDEKIKVLHKIKELYCNGVADDLIDDNSERESIEKHPEKIKEDLKLHSATSKVVHDDKLCNGVDKLPDVSLQSKEYIKNGVTEKTLKHATNDIRKLHDAKKMNGISNSENVLQNDLEIDKNVDISNESIQNGNLEKTEILKKKGGTMIAVQNNEISTQFSDIENLNNGDVNTESKPKMVINSKLVEVNGNIANGFKENINLENVEAIAATENYMGNQHNETTCKENTAVSTNEKVKVLTAMQELHKRKTKTNENDKKTKNDEISHKGKEQEQIKQVYKSNGASIQLLIEPLSNFSKQEINHDEHVAPLPDPISIPDTSQISIEQCKPGIIEPQPSGAMFRATVSLPPGPATCVSKTPKTPDTSVLKCIWDIAKQDREVLEKTANAVQILTPKHTDKVATLQDIIKLAKNLDKGLDATLKWGDEILHGRNVYITRGKTCFVPGLRINNNFIAGQTIEDEFVAGLTVKTASKIGLIPGCVMKDGGFVAGMSKEGNFIEGQIVNTGEKEEFVAGQTIMTPDGPRFVVGQVLDECFVPGMIVNTEDGPQFIQGQSPEPGEFQPGQVCYKTETGEPIFIAGQTVTENGECKFVPGRTLATPQGPQFIPGREVKDGKNIFIPGKTENNTFIPGTVLETSNGEEFIEGRVITNRSGKTRFMPGITEKDKFKPAKGEQEIRKYPAPELKVPFIQDVTRSTVYGHMVQKASEVQFYPEGNVLPTKGVIRSIPGKLVKSIDDEDEPSFMPGMMIDGKFVSGQMVRTMDGTKFVPGELVKNKTGVKFVPGQTLEDGQFVPGQLVDDKFVPGQIVQTAAGPTFIPGQVISTPEEGARFVPGRVVETSQGPHFVPARVIEDGHGGVAFIPGRVVETVEGLRYVAPDLESAPDGTIQYSMQSFEVSPEELKLIDQQKYKNIDDNGNIDSTMLCQLARAGISISQKTLPDVYICPVKNLEEIATHITERLKLPEEAQAKMSLVLQKVAEVGHNIRTKKCDIKDIPAPKSIITSKDQIKAYELIETAILAALTTASNDVSLNPDEAIIQEMSILIEETIPKNGSSISAEFLLKALYEIVNSHATLEAITSSVQKGLKRPVANKVEVLKDILNKTETLQETVAKISTVLRKPKTHLDIGKAFKRLSIGDPELVELVVSKVGEKVDNVSTEKQAANTLQNSIVSAVREASEKQMHQILDNSDHRGLQHLILQAVGLARALGLNDAAEELTILLEDTRIAAALAKDRTALEILQRLTLMKKLSESRPAFAQALGNLSSVSKKEDARYLKQLVRESEALLTAVREEEDSLASDDEDYSYTNSSFNSTFDDEIINRVPAHIKSSHDIPAALFHALVDCQKPAQLLLKLLSAIGEDRMYSYDHACVILKNNIQAVIPKESSRSVLTGKASYTLIDEKGVKQFGALDVFSALNINKPFALSRFKLYTAGLESTWAYAREMPPPPVLEDELISTEVIENSEIQDLPSNVTNNQQNAVILQSISSLSIKRSLSEGDISSLTEVKSPLK